MISLIMHTVGYLRRHATTSSHYGQYTLFMIKHKSAAIFKSTIAIIHCFFRCALWPLGPSGQCLCVDEWPVSKVASSITIIATTALWQRSLGARHRYRYRQKRFQCTSLWQVHDGSKSGKQKMTYRLAMDLMEQSKQRCIREGNSDRHRKTHTHTGTTPFN